VCFESTLLARQFQFSFSSFPAGFFFLSGTSHRGNFHSVCGHVDVTCTNSCLCKSQPWHAVGLSAVLTRCRAAIQRTEAQSTSDGCGMKNWLNSIKICFHCCRMNHNSASCFALHPTKRGKCLVRYICLHQNPNDSVFDLPHNHTKRSISLIRAGRMVCFSAAGDGRTTTLSWSSVGSNCCSYTMGCRWI